MNEIKNKIKIIIKPKNILIIYKMAEVIFNYEGNLTTIQCNKNDKMNDIINKFLFKIKTNENINLYYLYNGNKINNELTFQEQANELDKNRKKMNIIVNQNDKDKEEAKLIISKDIICPECKENIIMDITINTFLTHHYN